ncbi:MULTISPECIES: DMT family transporter [unclassified Methylobacterium]|uniref:DMT family transporter n=1 Tax=unclassified Methylobacterium TaxID=2615210 RepID=UPI0006F9C0F2|nr:MULTISPECIES: DMT family transporter [unclassified Methylobacterium]KQO49223.1 ABC transporter permease [Methylobacterium sp. Leaf86]KQP00552.1 ABC transporter permease [Methylobacterium sp. Leaf91]
MPSEMNRPMSAAEYTALIVLSMLWGGSFFFTSVALTALPPLTLVVLRVGLAALVLIMVLPFAGLRLPRQPGPWVAFAGMGLLNNVLPFCLIVWGQTHIASGLAAILNATTPLFAVIVAHLLTVDERMTVSRLVGVILGFAGVVAMVGPDVLTGLGADVLAQLAVLAAAFSYALAGVFGRRFKLMGVSPFATAAGQVTASALMLLPVALVVDRPWTLAMPDPPVWGAVLAIATVSTALAYVLYFRLLASAGATNLLLVTFLIPISAILLGASMLGEVLEARHYLGIMLIGCGLVAIDGRFWALVQKRKRSLPEIHQGRDI